MHRHSESDCAHIRLFEENGAAVLEIEDEGKGFPAAMLDLEHDDLTSSFGVGLRGMNERLRDLGGIIELKPAKKQGAMLRAVVPLKQGQPAIEDQKTITTNNESAA